MQPVGDEKFHELRPISNPSETDSYCSTVIYSSRNLISKGKVVLDNHGNNENIEECISDHTIPTHLNTSLVSSSNDIIDSDHSNCDRNKNLSFEKHSSSSLYG